MTTAAEADLTASNVTWDLEPLLQGAATASDLLDRAKELAEALQPYRGRVGTLDAEELATLMTKVADVNELDSEYLTGLQRRAPK